MAQFCSLIQVAHSIQQQWPLRELVIRQTQFEIKVYHTLLQMGYQAHLSHECEDGLHAIDVALLPQRNLPCKVAIEADGPVHFLHEDFRLDNMVQPATRYCCACLCVALVIYCLSSITIILFM